MHRLICQVFLATLAFAPILSEAGPREAILYHEALVLQNDGPEVAQANGGQHRLRFDAFGRRVELLLDNGGKINRYRTSTDFQLLRGVVAGAPGSWARLTIKNNSIDGMFWDGTEAYVIQPRKDATEYLVAGDDQPSENVIYRLADVMMTGGALACGAEMESPQISGQMAMNKLAAEMSAVRTMEAQGATLRLSVATIADFEFLQDFAGSVQLAENAILTRFNIVDGIYSEQLGIEIDLVDLRVFTSPTEEEPPLSDTTSANTLLDQFSDYRQANHSTIGHSHMISGRDFSGSTAGIAYQGFQLNGALIFGVCDLETAASISDGGFNTTTHALIIAHELGHNFGAPHDGEPDPDPGETNPCESTPQTFLMSPDINGNDQFSSCSINQMEPVIDAARASCLTEIEVEGVAASGVSAVSQAPNQEFNLAFSINNTGVDPATNVTAQLTISPALELVSLTANSGSCDQGMASCDLGTLNAGISRVITARVQGTNAGTFSVTTSADADIDNDLSDNDHTIRVTIASTPPTSGGGGGGGGSVTPVGMLSLTLLALLRRRFYIFK